MNSTHDGDTASPTAVARLREVPPLAWVIAAVGGFLGSVPLGLMMQFGNPEPLIALPTMYGLAGPNLFAGWALHQFHGIALGVGYVAVVQSHRLDPHATTLYGAVGLAVVDGAVTTAVLSVLLMPLWLGLVGYPYAPPFRTWRCPRNCGASSATSSTRCR